MRAGLGGHPANSRTGSWPRRIEEVVAGVRQSLPRFEVVVHEIVGAAGHAGVRASFTGTHLGEIFGVAVTGKSVDVALHDFHHLKDGRITHTWHVEDWFLHVAPSWAWPPRKQ